MSRKNHNPISWVPTVYFAMGLPFVVLNMVSVLMFKGMGIGDAQILLWWLWRCSYRSFLRYALRCWQ